MRTKLSPDSTPFILRRREAASKDGPPHDGLDWAPAHTTSFEAASRRLSDEGTGIAVD